MGEQARTNPIVNFCAGGVAGSCAVLVGQPFDTVKVRVQTAGTLGVVDGAVYKSTFDCFKQTVTKEGFFALYKGMAAPLVGVSPLFALYFFGCSVGKRLQQKTPDEALSIFKTFNAGALAGVMTTVIMTPGERIKCLLQVQSASSGPPKYAGPVDVARQLYKQGGIRSIYKGTMGTFLRDIPASGAYLASYEYMMRVLTGTTNREQLSPAKTMLAGGIAGICNWGVCLPADVLKNRLQAAPEGKYNGVRDVFRELIREEGVLALWKGFTPVFLRAFPANAAAFMGYELTMKLGGWVMGDKSPPPDPTPV